MQYHDSKCKWECIFLTGMCFNYYYQEPMTEEHGTGPLSLHITLSSTLTREMLKIVKNCIQTPVKHHRKTHVSSHLTAQ